MSLQEKPIVESGGIDQIPVKVLLHLSVITCLLLFSSLLAIFNSNLTANFADGYRFMQFLRGIFNRIWTDMINYANIPGFQTPAMASNLYNIFVFNFLYTNILLLTSHSTLTIIFNLPPNPAILDVIVGYTILIYCAGDLIKFIHGDQLHIPKSIWVNVFFLIIGISGSVMIVGFMFWNYYVISMAALVIILSVAVIGIFLPIK